MVHELKDKLLLSAIFAVLLFSFGNAYAGQIIDFQNSPRNKILNGSMRFDQNKKGSSYISSNQEIYSLDQWRFAGAADGSFEIRQSNCDLPEFKKSLKVTVLESRKLVGTHDNHHLEYPIEGRYIRDLHFGSSHAAKVSLSFFARYSKPGIKSIALMNGQNTRSYLAEYTIHRANEWEKIEITFPGDTEGQWVTEDGAFGLKIIWSFGVGEIHTRQAGSLWVDYGYWNSTGTDQLIDEAAGSTFELTGVQFEIGSKPTSFEHLSEIEELLRLSRYYQKIGDLLIENNRLGGF